MEIYCKRWFVGFWSIVINGIFREQIFVIYGNCAFKNPAQLAPKSLIDGKGTIVYNERLKYTKFFCRNFVLKLQKTSLHAELALLRTKQGKVIFAHSSPPQTNCFNTMLWHHCSEQAPSCKKKEWAFDECLAISCWPEIF